MSDYNYTDILSILGSDIIESEIVPLLSSKDIRSLKLTSKSLYSLINQSSTAWKQLFRKTFGTEPTPYSLTKWPELYKLRAKGELYTWGTVSNGRLGFTQSDQGIIPKENFLRRGFMVGVARPSKVPGINAILADVSAGGFSFQILTDKGDIYSTGASYHCGHRTGPGPIENDYNELLDMARFQEEEQRNTYLAGLSDAIRSRVRLAPVNPFNTRIDVPPITEPPLRTPAIPSSPYVIPVATGISNDDGNSNGTASIHNKNITKYEAKIPGTKFASISSGRCHFIGLSTSGNIWSWDNLTELGVQIGFSDNITGEDLEAKGHRVLKAVAGWDSTVAYLYDYGLIYWKDREGLKEGETKAKARFHKVPNTGDLNGKSKVIDFIVGESFLIYLTEGGEIYRNDLIEQESYLLVNFQNYLKENSNSVNSKFTRLTGSYKNFAVFSNEDLVLIGSKESSEPLILPELQNKGCINVSVGDYHFLALLKDGTLLSWGKELRTCGCLGLGASTTVQATIRVDQIIVLKPSVIPIPEGYKVVAIAAAGWQSSAIISREDD